MTKRELKEGRTYTETFEGKVNVLVAVDGTFHGWEHHGRQEMIVAFDHVPTQEEVKEWVSTNIFQYCISNPEWTEITFSYLVLDNYKANKIKIK